MFEIPPGLFTESFCTTRLPVPATPGELTSTPAYEPLGAALDPGRVHHHVVEHDIAAGQPHRIVSDHEPRTRSIDHVVVNRSVLRTGIDLHTPPMRIVPHPIVIDLNIVAMREIDQMIKRQTRPHIMNPVVTNDRVIRLTIPTNPNRITPQSRNRLIDVVVLQHIIRTLDEQPLRRRRRTTRILRRTGKRVRTINIQPRQRHERPLHRNPTHHRNLLTRIRRNRNRSPSRPTAQQIMKSTRTAIRTRTQTTSLTRRQRRIQPSQRSERPTHTPIPTPIRTRRRRELIAHHRSTRRPAHQHQRTQNRKQPTNHAKTKGHSGAPVRSA